DFDKWFSETDKSNHSQAGQHQIDPGHQSQLLAHLRQIALRVITRKQRATHGGRCVENFDGVVDQSYRYVINGQLLGGEQRGNDEDIPSAFYNVGEIDEESPSAEMEEGLECFLGDQCCRDQQIRMAAPSDQEK